MKEFCYYIAVNGYIHIAAKNEDEAKNQLNKWIHEFPHLEDSSWKIEEMSVINEDEGE